MILASLIFLYLFLPLNLILYFFSKSTAVKNTVLLVFSLVFYAWGRPAWMLLLVFTAFCDWKNAKTIEKYRGTGKAKLALIASLVLDIGIFVAFKYSGFLAENVNALFSSALPVPELELPIGISFYTFQTLTYVIDVYRGTCKAQQRFPKYLLYLSMYFQLVAGPIVRYTDVANEIEARKHGVISAYDGVQRFLCGLAKKVVIADTASILVKKYMDADISSLPILAAWLGSFMYAIQLYFDFSGYSDMAIGLGKIFGFKFPENFNYPYISKSVSEFWRRWHMTLGGFFRDYVYIPMGGNRKHVFFNLFVVWFLTGFWHGASWNFIVWGLYNGLFIMLERLFKNQFEKIPAVIKHIYLILVVDIGFVFFYFKDIGKAFAYIRVMFGGGSSVSSTDFGVTFMNYIYFIILAIILCAPVSQLLKRFSEKVETSSAFGTTTVGVVRNVSLFVILVVCTAMLAGNSYSPFLYFQF